MTRMYCSCRCVGVAADRLDVLALRGVVDVGEARVIELQVAAAEVVDALELLGVGGGEVVPEDVEVGIHIAIDRRVAAAVVDHARRRDRQLRRLVRVGVVAHEREGVGEDRARGRPTLPETRIAGGA